MTFTSWSSCLHLQVLEWQAYSLRFLWCWDENQDRDSASWTTFLTLSLHPWPQEMDNLNSLAFEVLQDLIYHHWQEHRGAEKRNQVLYSSDSLAKLCRSKLTTLCWRLCFRWSDVSWCDVEFWEQSPVFDVRLVGCGQYLLLNSSCSVAPLVNPSAVYHCFKVMSICTQGHSCLPSSSFSGSFFRGLFYPSSFVK